MSPVGDERHEVDPGPDLVATTASDAAWRPLGPVSHSTLNIILNLHWGHNPGICYQVDLTCLVYLLPPSQVTSLPLPPLLSNLLLLAMLRLRQAGHSCCLLTLQLVLVAVEPLVGLVVVAVALGRGCLLWHHEVLVTPGALLAVLIFKQLQRAEGRVEVGVLPGPGPDVE